MKVERLNRKELDAYYFDGMIILASSALQIQRANNALHSDNFSAVLQNFR